MEIVSLILGWVGMIFAFAGYLLVSLKKIDSASMTYQLMNLVAAACLGINVFYQQAWPALTLQIVWGSVALYALVRVRKN